MAKKIATGPVPFGQYLGDFAELIESFPGRPCDDAPLLAYPHAAKSVASAFAKLRAAMPDGAGVRVGVTVEVPANPVGGLPVRTAFALALFIDAAANRLAGVEYAIDSPEISRRLAVAFNALNDTALNATGVTVWARVYARKSTADPFG